VAATSLGTVLICLVLLVRENKNGKDLLDIQEHGGKYSQETRKNLQDLSSEIHERGTKHSQETRKNLQNLEDSKVSELVAEMSKLIQSQKLESGKREKDINSVKAENKRLQEALSSQKLEFEKREKEMNSLRAENKRFQEELSSTNGIRKKIEDLEKAVKKLSPAPPNE
jgi:chromosome segregation ATPase